MGRTTVWHSEIIVLNVSLIFQDLDKGIFLVCRNSFTLLGKGKNGPCIATTSSFLFFPLSLPNIFNAYRLPNR